MCLPVNISLTTPEDTGQFCCLCLLIQHFSLKFCKRPFSKAPRCTAAGELAGRAGLMQQWLGCDSLSPRRRAVPCSPGWAPAGPLCPQWRTRPRLLSGHMRPRWARHLARGSCCRDLGWHLKQETVAEKRHSVPDSDSSLLCGISSPDTGTRSSFAGFSVDSGSLSTSWRRW